MAVSIPDGTLLRGLPSKKKDVSVSKLPMATGVPDRLRRRRTLFAYRCEKMLRRLRLLLRTFTPVEEQILQLVGDTLPDDHRSLFYSQVKSINKVQRTLDWTEINFYCMEFGKVRWNPNLLFPNRAEFEIGTVDYRIKGVRFATNLSAVGGHIFSLVTRPNIKPYCLDRIDEVEAVTITGDPGDRMSGIDINVDFPPNEFLQYIESAESPEVQGWHILTLPEVYRVPLPAGDFLILGVRQGEEYLMTPDKPEDSGVYFIIVEDNKVYRQTKSFRKVLISWPDRSLENKERTERNTA